MGASFHSLLLHCLYPLLEKHGCDEPVVRQAALATLQLVAAAVCACECGCKSVAAVVCECKSLHYLLSNNLDYIVDAVVARLRYDDDL